MTNQEKNMKQEVAETIDLFESVVAKLEVLAEHDGCLYENDVVERSNNLSAVHTKLIELQDRL